MKGPFTRQKPLFSKTHEKFTLLARNLLIKKAIFKGQG
jgi:hypothetical protein